MQESRERGGVGRRGEVGGGKGGWLVDSGKGSEVGCLRNGEAQVSNWRKTVAIKLEEPQKQRCRNENGRGGVCGLCGWCGVGVGRERNGEGAEYRGSAWISVLHPACWAG